MTALTTEQQREATADDEPLIVGLSSASGFLPDLRKSELHMICFP